MFTIFFALMASASARSREEVWAYPVFLGLGLGVVTSTRGFIQNTTCSRRKKAFLVMRANFRAVVTTAQLSTPPELIASATGIIIGIRALGGSVGIPICKSISYIYIPKCTS